MKIQRIKSLVIKEMTQAYKDPSSIITALIFPLLFLFLYGFGVSLDMDSLEIGIVTEDLSPLARGLMRSLTTTPYLKTRIFTGSQEAEHLLKSGDLNGIVIIPSYFSDYYYNKDKTAPLQVIADGSDPNTAKFVQNYIQTIANNWLRQLAFERGEHSQPFVNVISRVWYNQALRSVYFLIPGSIVVIITITGAFLTSLVIAREWERGTMEGLMSTPVTMGEIVLGKLIAYFLLGVAAMLLCYFVAWYIYFVPFRGSYLALALVSLTYLSFALNMGLFISISVRDQFAASQITIVTTYLPAFILSGFIFDIASMPQYLRLITYLVPARYFVDSLKTIFLVGDVWEILLPNMFFMGIASFLMFLLVQRKCIKRLD